MMSAKERLKQIEDHWTERFMRRAAGRITRRDARDLGRRWRDVSVRHPFDALDGRTFAEDFVRVKRYGAAAIANFGESCRNRFYFYGPRWAEWPGDQEHPDALPGLARASVPPSPLAAVA